MPGHAEAAHGTDKATNIMKFEGLPEKGKLISEETSQPKEVPVLGGFVSSMGTEGGVEFSSFSSVSAFGDAYKKPKFTAKITLLDSHSDDNF